MSRGPPEYQIEESIFGNKIWTNCGDLGRDYKGKARGSEASGGSEEIKSINHTKRGGATTFSMLERYSGDNDLGLQNGLKRLVFLINYWE